MSCRNKIEISSWVPGFSVYVKKWIKNPESQFDFSKMDKKNVQKWKVEFTFGRKNMQNMHKSIMVTKNIFGKKFEIVKN